MQPKQHNVKNKHEDPKDTAGKMADAVSYLCRVAAEEGFCEVLVDLLSAREKLETIATAGQVYRSN
ncbi:hypothetical protein [Bradyrhizobium brasilense]|uniref:Uncharacterized protein n=1 Tax=Bradyrhizobium brasilense TaxID=1419277 RepID=A0ABY8JBV3_9BRAD|nr:hypothetical protein [Bradyrhizobium brasilense]WFU62669.1 hypothetical protein QA636_35350 [Bradyrhizobium brasilense]